MVELRGLRTKAGFNIAQALAPDQLRECEAQILIEARKPLDPALAVVARHATTKRCQRQVLHKLGKDIMALMHGDTLAAVGPHRCAAFPFTIEIETAPKSLFFPKFQHVSVGPTSNVGTAVSIFIFLIFHDRPALVRFVGFSFVGISIVCALLYVPFGRNIFASLLFPRRYDIAIALTQ